MKFPAFEFDDGFDGVARSARKMAPSRWVTVAAYSVLVAVTLSRQAATIWAACFILAEFWSWLATNPHARGGALTRGDRVFYLTSAVAVNAVWVGLGLAYWVAGFPGAEYFALLLWSALLLNGMSHSYRSPLACLVFGAPSALCILITPFVLPRFDGFQQAFVLIGVVTPYAWRALRRLEAEDLAAAG